MAQELADRKGWTDPTAETGAGAAARVVSVHADVIRCGNDGTATFDAVGKSDVQRRILSVQRKRVAADAMGALTFTRQDDLTTVAIGDEERQEIPDAYLRGG